MSGDGFQTSVWGPCTWVTLHLFSLNYTPARKRGYQLLIDGLKETLPCVHCRNNFQKNWQSALKAMRQRGVRVVRDERQARVERRRVFGADDVLVPAAADAAPPARARASASRPRRRPGFALTLDDTLAFNISLHLSGGACPH